jgi:hypothetical protein
MLRDTSPIAGRRFFACAEADDDFKYVLKFKGAGHGVKALIAELIGGEIVF